MFSIGLLGLLFCGRHLILILICFELILLSISALFVFFSVLGQDLFGQIIPLILLCLAGADSAFGLALFLLLFKHYGTIKMATLEQLRH
jgi:NADH:ubiquinone oxidoreductase subunit K